VDDMIVTNEEYSALVLSSPVKVPLITAIATKKRQPNRA
jgi:hypothetical protein